MRTHDSSFHTPADIKNQALTGSNTLTLLLKTAEKYHFLKTAAEYFTFNIQGTQKKSQVELRKHSPGLSAEDFAALKGQVVFHHSREKGRQ